MNTKTNGISGVQFAVLMTIVLAVFYALGVLVAPAGVVPNVLAQVAFALVVVIKTLLVLASSTIAILVVFTQVLDMKVGEILPSLRKAENLSYGVMAGAIAGVMAIAVSFSTGATLQLYLYALLTKGAIGLLLDGIVVFVVARTVGVTSMDELAVYAKTVDNNQMIIFLAVVANVIMLVAMTTW